MIPEMLQESFPQATMSTVGEPIVYLFRAAKWRMLFAPSVVSL